MNYSFGFQKIKCVRDCSGILFWLFSSRKRYSGKPDRFLSFFKRRKGKRPKINLLLSFLSVCIYALPLVSFAEQEEVYLKEYFENGQLKSEGWTKGDAKIKYWKFYYSNGKLKKEGHYRNNLKENYWKYYFENGNMKKEGFYVDDLKNKYWKCYYQNGKLKEEGRYDFGKRNKYWLFYFDNGNVKEEGFYEKNARIKYWVFFYPNKEKKEEGHYLNGLKSKWWVFYNSLGEVQKKCQFVEDKSNGYCLVYENEKLVKAEKYVNDKKVNEWTSYSSFRKENNLSDLK